MKSWVRIAAYHRWLDALVMKLSQVSCQSSNTHCLPMIAWHTGRSCTGPLPCRSLPLSWRSFLQPGRFLLPSLGGRTKNNNDITQLRHWGFHVRDDRRILATHRSSRPPIHSAILQRIYPFIHPSKHPLIHSPHLFTHWTILAPICTSVSPSSSTHLPPDTHTHTNTTPPPQPSSLPLPTLETPIYWFVPPWLVHWQIRTPTCQLIHPPPLYSYRPLPSKISLIDSSLSYRSTQWPKTPTPIHPSMHPSNNSFISHYIPPSTSLPLPSYSPPLPAPFRLVSIRRPRITVLLCLCRSVCLAVCPFFQTPQETLTDVQQKTWAIHETHSRTVKDETGGLTYFSGRQKLHGSGNLISIADQAFQTQTSFFLIPMGQPFSFVTFSPFSQECEEISVRAIFYDHTNVVFTAWK